MPFATVRTRALAGIDAPPVTVEVHLGGGLPGMALVGLPESTVRESRERVRAAIRNAGLRFPRVKVVVNLAPADLPKRGGRFDLPIALGVLAASEQLPPEALDGVTVVGELGLGGELRAVDGALVVALACRAAGESLLLPAANLAEARRCPGVRIAAVATLGEAVEALRRPEGAAFASVRESDVRAGGVRAGGRDGADARAVSCPATCSGAPEGADLADVIGQHAARRALEVAAAGGHDLLLRGPPGTGKSMLASRLVGILPPMSEREAGEVAALASIARGGFDAASWGRRPFRAPHHTVSGIALVGGGVPPRPGEISLAHHGVLFLDELTEFRRAVLDVLREPMESGRVAISRGAWQIELPARFQLVAAMNGCPCGRRGDDDRAEPCRCTPDRIDNYLSRLSAPFLERIDLHVELPRERLPLATLADPRPAGGESSAVVRARATTARRRQNRRQGCANAVLAPARLAAVCAADAAGRALLERAAARFGLSLRAVHRTLRVARTLADLDGGGAVRAEHLHEALGYRERRDVVAG